MSCFWQGIFVFLKNIRYVSNYVLYPLCYNDTIKKGGGNRLKGNGGK